MIGLIVTGHGNFGTGLTSSLKLIAGEPKDYVAVDFTIDLSTEQLEERLDAAMTSLEATCDGGILVLSDLGGGSPFKTAVMCSLKHQNVEVVAGTNLPMLLEISMTREFASDVHSLAESALATGKDQVVKFDMASMVQSNQPADDEDGI